MAKIFLKFVDNRSMHDTSNTTSLTDESINMHRSIKDHTLVDC